MKSVRTQPIHTTNAATRTTGSIVSTNFLG
jgi:hypothetical protein